MARKTLKGATSPASNKQISYIKSLIADYGFKDEIPEGITQQEAGDMIDGLLKLTANAPMELFNAFQSGYKAMAEAEADDQPPVNAFLVIYDAPKSLNLPASLPKEVGLKVRDKHNRENDEYRSVRRPKISPVLPEGTTRAQEMAFWAAVKEHLSAFRWKTEDEDGCEGFAIRTA